MICVFVGMFAGVGVWRGADNGPGKSKPATAPSAHPTSPRPVKVAKSVKSIDAINFAGDDLCIQV